MSLRCVHCIYVNFHPNVNSCGTRCFYLPSNCSERQTAPRAFSLSNAAHAAGACSGEAEWAGTNPLNQSPVFVGGAAASSEPIGERPASDRLGHRVPGPRELEQLLYAGRQRAGAFSSPEKNTLTFSGLQGNRHSRAALHGFVAQAQLFTDINLKSVQLNDVREPGERDIFRWRSALVQTRCKTRKHTNVPRQHGYIRKRQYICTRFKNTEFSTKSGTRVGVSHK